MMQKILTVILDGFGYREEEYGNAIKLADTKNFDKLWNTYPHTTLYASEEYVGLNAGEFGNSEIGHMTIGAGRRIMQHGPRITEFLKNINKDNHLFNEMITEAQEKTIHIMGLYSDGKVHSNLDHFLNVYELLKENNAKKIHFHLITDGRDTKINAALNFIRDLEEKIADDPNTDIATICGRYYAMDRDTNYDRTKIYYDLLTKGIGIKAKSATDGILNLYKKNQTDEFLYPLIINQNGTIKDGDIILWMNFRSDRAKQILRTFAKENFEELFPADFICEGIDQTRGWFYSLLAISTFVMGKAPYKRVLVNDLVLDKEGKKMSKSRGNTVNPFELFDQYGADALRWYLLYVSPPWTPTRFDVDGLKEVQSKFLGTMKNVYNFFTLYANTDEVNPKDFFVDYKNRPELDRWILSKFNNLKKEVEENLEIFELNKTVRMIQDFINEDLSNWYIRRSRRRFWATELTEDKKSVYNTTYEILTELCGLIAPFAPYISEEIYRNLTGEVSVHLSSYPKANLELINPELEEKMDLVKNLVTLGRASREATRIKVRQPIQKVLVDGKFEDTISDVVDLIKEELNVKEVVFAKDLGEYMNFSLKPNFKVLGPVLGAKMKFFAGALNKLNSNEVAPKLEAGESLTVDIDGENFEFNKEHVLVNISAKEGFNVSMENNLFVILDTTLTTELIEEGYAREFISKIQQIRKASNFDVLDNIEIDFCGDDEIAQAIENFKDYIKSETLALEINRVDDESLEKHNLNDHMTGIKVTRK